MTAVLVCPHCRSRAVGLREAVLDHYRCDVCGWSVFTTSPEPVDDRKRKQLSDCNGGIPIGIWAGVGFRE